MAVRFQRRWQFRVRAGADRQHQSRLCAQRQFAVGIGLRAVILQPDHDAGTFDLENGGAVAIPAAGATKCRIQFIHQIGEFDTRKAGIDQRRDQGCGGMHHSTSCDVRRKDHSYCGADPKDVSQ